MTQEDDLGVLAITHYARLLTELRPDRVHVILAGRIVRAAAPSSPTSSSAPATKGIAAELGIDDAAPSQRDRQSTTVAFADPGFVVLRRGAFTVVGVGFDRRRGVSLAP